MMKQTDTGAKKQFESHTDREEKTMTDSLTRDHTQATATPAGWALNKVLLALGILGNVVIPFLGRR